MCAHGYTVVIGAIAKSTRYSLACRFTCNSQVCSAVCQFRTLKCEAINLTLSDSDSDGDFIQAKKAIHSFLYIKFLLHQVPTTTDIISQDLCMMYCSLTKSGRLISIARSWKFCFAMITSVRAK